MERGKKAQERGKDENLNVFTNFLGFSQPWLLSKVAFSDAFKMRCSGSMYHKTTKLESLGTMDQIFTFIKAPLIIKMYSQPH